jgi:hypothetical protein
MAKSTRSPATDEIMWRALSKPYKEPDEIYNDMIEEGWKTTPITVRRFTDITRQTATAIKELKRLSTVEWRAAAACLCRPLPSRGTVGEPSGNAGRRGNSLACTVSEHFPPDREQLV